MEIRKHDGAEYPPDSLYQMCCALQREYNDMSGGVFRNPVKIFDPADSSFFRLYSVLDSKMAELQRKGLGFNTQQADPFTEDDENRLWESNMISLDDAQGLLYGAYFYNNLCFGLRAGDEHRDLQVEQYAFVEEGGKEKLMFQGRLNKQYQGGLKHRKIKPKQGELFAQPDNPRCPVQLFKKYLSLIPATGPFYKRPKKASADVKSLGFTTQVVGVHSLRHFLPRMFQQEKKSKQNDRSHLEEQDQLTQIFVWRQLAFLKES